MGELYSRFAPRAFGVARRVLRSDAEAEEVVQDSFLEVWRTATRYDPRRAAPERWILTIVRTRAIDRLRQHGARVRMGESIGREPSPPPVSGADDRVSEAREARRLREAMEKLPSEQRKVLEQAYDQGLTQSEIASATNTPLGTVKTRMRIGMLKLAELLET
ncbi:MAG: RNA polymerase subunit sigma [Archangium gephyra]|uniref:RNA polymerase subunit sigma n=1 Tax=Archangium gephyra TaxID=48 RepID=A0A2W5TBQ2_9BACT|nr:MAG: RNA polymerase subunit sigma [Archangium gephyra]